MLWIFALLTRQTLEIQSRESARATGAFQPCARSAGQVSAPLRKFVHDSRKDSEQNFGLCRAAVGLHLPSIGLRLGMEVRVSRPSTQSGGSFVGSYAGSKRFLQGTGEGRSWTERAQRNPALRGAAGPSGESALNVARPRKS